MGGLCDREAGIHPARQPGRAVLPVHPTAGERSEEYRFNAFLATRDGDEVEELAGDFPKRWHVEEFFNTHQALGRDRAGRATSTSATAR